METFVFENVNWISVLWTAIRDDTIMKCFLVMIFQMSWQLTDSDSDAEFEGLGEAEMTEE